MNIPKLLSILQRQPPSDSLNAFVDGAMRTVTTIISGNPSAIKAVLPSHAIFALNDIDKIRDGTEVMFDPAALIAIVSELSGVSLPAIADRKPVGFRVINSNWHTPRSVRAPDKAPDKEIEKPEDLLAPSKTLVSAIELLPPANGKYTIINPK